MTYSDQGQWLLRDGQHYLDAGYVLLALQKELIKLQLNERPRAHLQQKAHLLAVRPAQRRDL